VCASRLLCPVFVHPVFLFFNANPFPPSFCVHGAEQRGHGNAVLSASLDGTVRAFDLTRYRNFRTLTAPTPTQFISLAVDQSGVCARACVSLCGNCRCWERGAACFCVLEPVHVLVLFGAGEIVCAGAMDPFNIFIWSMQVCVHCLLHVSCIRGCFVFGDSCSKRLSLMHTPSAMWTCVCRRARSWMCYPGTRAPCAAWHLRPTRWASLRWLTVPIVVDWR
jgi:hypothetical protein